MVLPRLISKQWSKHLFVLGFGLVASVSSHSARAACGDSVDAKGRVFYVIPDGDLVAREVTLTVPACGQGSVVLSSESGWRTETTTFWSKETAAGRKLFVVVFQNPKGDDPNHYLVLKGSYIRGKNAAKYWGDMYKLNLPEGSNLQKDAQQMADEGTLSHYGRHAGGFGFKADVPPPAPAPAPTPEPMPAPSTPTFVD